MSGLPEKFSLRNMLGAPSRQLINHGLLPHIGSDSSHHIHPVDFDSYVTAYFILSFSYSSMIIGDIDNSAVGMTVQRLSI